MLLLRRTNAVLGGEVPIVIINGMAKANPAAVEVALEFRRDKLVGDCLGRFRSPW
jgi:hypothetical protein